MMSSNYVHHTERRPINGLFLYKRKQLTKKKKKNNNNKQTNNQIKRRGGQGESNNLIHFDEQP